MPPHVEIDPADVLHPGTRDARRLLNLWVIRQSAIPVFWLGFMVGVLVSAGNEIHINYESPEDAFRELATPAAGIACAILIRLGTSFAGIALAFPVTGGFEAPGRASGSYSGKRLDRWLDRFEIARGYRSLRFTRYVRDAAVARLGTAGVVYDRIDRGITVSGFALPVVTILVIAVF